MDNIDYALRTVYLKHGRKYRKPARKLSSGFACQECGRKFRTVKAAESAAFGNEGCPKCGGSDIDLQ